jgi:hypothetical protein
LHNGSSPFGKGRVRVGFWVVEWGKAYQPKKNYGSQMVRSARLELATSALSEQCSNQLSYERIVFIVAETGLKINALSCSRDSKPVKRTCFSFYDLFIISA